MTVKSAAAEVKICLTREYFLLKRSSDGTFNLVLKRGAVPIFQGGLISRLSLFSAIPSRIVHNA
jgi:hypothetical protein